jgi:hypothetical protein
VKAPELSKLSVKAPEFSKLSEKAPEAINIHPIYIKPNQSSSSEHKKLIKKPLEGHSFKEHENCLIKNSQNVILC